MLQNLEKNSLSWAVFSSVPSAMCVVYLVMQSSRFFSLFCQYSFSPLVFVSFSATHNSFDRGEIAKTYVECTAQSEELITSQSQATCNVLHLISNLITPVVL